MTDKQFDDDGYDPRRKGDMTDKPKSRKPDTVTVRADGMTAITSCSANSLDKIKAKWAWRGNDMGENDEMFSEIKALMDEEESEKGMFKVLLDKALDEIAGKDKEIESLKKEVKEKCL